MCARVCEYVSPLRHESVCARVWHRRARARAHVMRAGACLLSCMAQRLQAWTYVCRHTGLQTQLHAYMQAQLAPMRLSTAHRGDQGSSVRCPRRSTLQTDDPQSKKAAICGRFSVSAGNYAGKALEVISGSPSRPGHRWARLHGRVHCVECAVATGRNGAF